MRRRTKFIPLGLFGADVEVRVPSNLYLTSEEGKDAKVKVEVKHTRQSVYVNLLVVEQIARGLFRIRAPGRKISYFSDSTGKVPIDGDLVLTLEELRRIRIAVFKRNGILEVSVIGKEIEREPEKLK